MAALLIALGGLVGAVVGSFVNVVLWRVPRHESVVRPPSHCTTCGTELRARDLVPVLSWVWLRGRCRACGARISIRYPVVEGAFAILGALLAWLLGG